MVYIPFGAKNNLQAMCQRGANTEQWSWKFRNVISGTVVFGQDVKTS